MIGIGVTISTSLPGFCIVRYVSVLVKNGCPALALLNVWWPVSCLTVNDVESRERYGAWSLVCDRTDDAGGVQGSGGSEAISIDAKGSNIALWVHPMAKVRIRL